MCVSLIAFNCAASLHVTFSLIKGAVLTSGRVTHLKRKFSKLILWYLNMSSIDLATWFKIEMYLLNRETRY